MAFGFKSLKRIRGASSPEAEFLLGIILTLVGGIMTLAQVTVLRDGVRTTGTVVKYVEITKENSNMLTSYKDIGRTHRPVIEYEDAAGKTYRIESSEAVANPDQGRPPEDVDVIYSRRNPINAVTADEAGLNGLAILILAAGLGALYDSYRRFSHPVHDAFPTAPAMPDPPPAPELMRYVREHRAHGTPDGKIRLELIEAGWQPTEAERAIRQTAQEDEEKSP